MEAVQWYEKYVSNTNIVLTEARNYIDKKELEKAARHLQEAEDLSPDDETRAEIKRLKGQLAANLAVVRELDVPPRLRQLCQHALRFAR